MKEEKTVDAKIIAITGSNALVAKVGGKSVKVKLPVNRSETPAVGETVKLKEKWITGACDEPAEEPKPKTEPKPHKSVE